VNTSDVKKNQVIDKNQNSLLPALTGVRFFAIFHIFLHHMWAVYNYHSGSTGATQGLFIGLEDAPKSLMIFMSNGWVSTSLFFLLSGFILAYLYWGEEGQFTTTKRRFWLLRFARIYPIHLIVIAILIFLKAPNYLDENLPLGSLISSAAATAALFQAWVPAWIPLWSWPTWTISVMLFLYLTMPFLVTILSRLSRRQQTITLVLMPFVSLIPTAVYASMLAMGIPWNMNNELFFSNFPLFWVPYFVAGMLLTRVFSLNRSSAIKRVSATFAWGDAAFILVIVIACLPDIEPMLRHLIRQGLLMPIYVVFLLDLARGKGLMAKVFALPGMGFLGETGFSIFIWQSVVIAGAFISLSLYPEIASYQVWLAVMFVMVLAIPSTYLIEKPFVRFIRRKYLS
jgi:peptidoglycan/LPS O-acetylase OafA/YrhL